MPSGSIKPNVFRLGIGLGSEIHNDLFAALQTLQPIAAPALDFHLVRHACLERGRGHLSHNMALQIMVESHEESRHGAAAVGAFA